MKITSITDQLRNNAIAILSLIVAIAALSFNTWREEVTEKNRNLRFAAFEMIKQLDELQLFLNNVQYDSNSPKNPLMGWGHIALIGDFARLMPEDVQKKAASLIKTWKSNLNDLKSNEDSMDKISTEIDQTRDAVLISLGMLK